MVDRVRVTVSVDPETLAAFVEMAEIGRTSLAKCIGDWLEDTCDAARLTVRKMQELRTFPDHLLETAAMQIGAERELFARRKLVDEARAGEAEAPSSNTGLNSLEKGRRVA